MNFRIFGSFFFLFFLGGGGAFFVVRDSLPVRTYKIMEYFNLTPALLLKKNKK